MIITSKVDKCKKNYTIVIPRVPPSMNSKTWRSKWPYNEEKSTWDYHILCLCKNGKVPKCKKIAVDITIYFEKPHERDWDNYSTAYKLVMDGLQKAQIIPRDSTRYVVRPMFPDQKIDPDNPRTEVTITPL